MSEYTDNDFAFDLLAGIYDEMDQILAEQGEAAMLDAAHDNAMTVGGLILDLEKAGYTDAEIQAEIHMRRYTDQGFTHITFGEQLE